MKAILNKRIVANAQPQDRPYELRDTQVRGLILRVQPSGHKAWVVTWAHGKRRTLGSTEHLTLDQARDQARQAVAEYVQSGLPTLAKSKPTSCTLGTLLTDHYEPWAKIEHKWGERCVARIRVVFNWLLRTQLVDIDIPTIEQWWRGRISGEKAVSKVTAARDIACLRSTLSKAVEWKLIEANPLLGMRQASVQSRTVVRFLSTDEEARLRASLATRDLTRAQRRAEANIRRANFHRPALPCLPYDGYVDHLTPVILLAMNTGLRRGELASLTWSDINLEAKMLTVRAENAKSGRQRHIPLNTEAFNALQQWARAEQTQALVFPVRDIKRGWESLLADAHIKHFRFHDLRHHFASRLVRVGVDLNIVRELLGHANITMTLRYAHLAPDTLAAAVAKLAT